MWLQTVECSKHQLLVVAFVSDFINIEGTNKLYDYSITNMFGQELIKGKSISNKIENLSKLTTGIYIITIKTENQIATFKIVKE